MSELDDFLATTLPRQVEAERAFHTGEMAPRVAIWSRQDPVTVLGAAGTCISGWEDVSQTFEVAASRFSNCPEYHFDLIAAGISGDLAYTVGYEHIVADLVSGPPAPYALRVTHIYRRENGDWKIVHRHADHPPVDQSTPLGPPPKSVRYSAVQERATTPNTGPQCGYFPSS